MVRRLQTIAPTLAALLFLSHANVWAQNKKPYEKHDVTALHDSLRDVINAGAKMYNENGDYAGCYRVYHGALLTIRSYLSHDLQQRIDSGIANAAKMRSDSDRAFELRAVLDEIRTKTNPGTPVAKKTDGFKSLFNGKDLAGWHNVNCAPSTWFVKDNMIITTGKPTGYLRTDRQYENFILEFEWMHVPPKKGAVGNSGLFVWGDPIPAMGTGYTRSIEVQVLVNLNVKDTYTSHGDLFSIWGAKCTPDRPHPKGWERCLPSENVCKGENEWNHYRVTANNGVLKLAVNGKEVSGVHSSNPRKGYLALESEGSECRFKNIKIQELPSTNPKPEEICDVDQGWQCLFTGLDLAGWKATDDHKAHWKMNDGVLNYDGKCTAKDPNLWSEKSYGDFELVCDWRFPGPAKKMKRPIILPSGETSKEEVEVLDAGDSGIYLRGSSKSQVNLWCWPVGSGEVWGYRTDKNSSPAVKAGVTPKMNADNKIGSWNRTIVRMKGDRLTVRVNGKLVIENAQLPGIAKSGPIALQHHGDPVQFRNVFVRELKGSE